MRLRLFYWGTELQNCDPTHPKLYSVYKKGENAPPRRTAPGRGPSGVCTRTRGGRGYCTARWGVYNLLY